MAGAISAGAYTAGVVDFLIQALDEWEAAKRFAREHPDHPQARECPPHEVRLRVMAGSSAGGMTAGLTAGLLGMRFESASAQAPPDKPATPWNNTLYRSWVNGIDIAPLLGSRDLGGGDLPVQSVLDSSVLRDIARDAFLFERPNERASRPYVADPLHVLLTVTNLRGVPYAPSFENWPKALQYEMTLHADHMHFVVSRDPPVADGAFWLKPDDTAYADTWGVLKDAALATGAFPVGLAPRLLRRPPAQYASRLWAVRGPHEEGGRHYCEYWKEIRPHWPGVEQAAEAAAADGRAYPYEFLCVDGGVMNNEPLDLARRVLAGPQGAEPAEGGRATRAVLMVLPFPNGGVFPTEYDGRTGLLDLLKSTFNALINQARFKPQELQRATDPDDYSRFLIVPRRGFRPDGSPEPYAIACGSLGGFGGFLSRKFREHDYQLGRRNCQWFLKQYFALPSEGEHANRLFDRWTPEARRRHRILRAGRGGLRDGKEVELPMLPVIPLLGSAAADVPAPQWPAFSEAELASLRGKIRARARRVATALINQNVRGSFQGLLARWALRAGWSLKEGSVVASIVETIRADLTERGLLR
jgi:hypothetical protein